MTTKATIDSIRFAPILALAVVLHLALLCAPLLLVADFHGITSSPRLAAFLCLVSVWCVVESSCSHTEMHRVKSTAGPYWLPLAVGLALLMTFWIMLADVALFARSPGLSLGIAGALLMGMGILLRFLAIRRLGEFFLNEVTLLPGQPLVTTGVYGRLRHPSETGTICLATGAAILLGSLAGLCAFASILLPCLIWRTRLEDEVLCRRHPVEFRHYARRVPAFLPWLRESKP